MLQNALIGRGLNNSIFDEEVKELFIFKRKTARFNKLLDARPIAHELACTVGFTECYRWGTTVRAGICAL